MNKQKLDYFRNLLLEQRQEAMDNLRADQADAIEDYDNVKDIGDDAKSDLNKSTAFELGGREQHLIEEIDDALQRIDDGTYGECERCGKPIDEKRLMAMPTARYDAECQAAIEAARGIETPSL